MEDPISTSERLSAQVIAWMRIAISIILLIASLYIILSRNFSAETGRLAVGVIGLIVGYWLR